MSEQISILVLCFRYSFRACSVIGRWEGCFSSMSGTYHVGSWALGMIEATEVYTTLWSDQGKGMMVDAITSGAIPIVINI